MLGIWLRKSVPVWIFIVILVLTAPLYNTLSHFGKMVKSGVISNIREGRQSPMRWMLGNAIYPVQSFLKQAGQAGQAARPGLPRIHLYIPQKSLNNLQSDLPKSSKVWQPASLLYDDGSIDRIKVKNRGDNARNYLFKKKSWRIKTRKKRLYNGSRVYTYIAPRTDAMIEPVFAFLIADYLGVLVPDPRLVELFINDESHGIVLETPHMNEGYLRKHGFMPVNLYKLDRDLDNILNDTGLGMQNANHWEKLARNNRYHGDDKQLLERYLNNYNKSLHDAGYLEELRKTAPYDIWRRYSVYDILTNNFHSGYANVRMIADDQSGHLVPIAWDPNLKAKLFGDFDSTEPGADSRPQAAGGLGGSPTDALTRRILGTCKMSIVCLYMRNSDYRLQVLQLLHQYLFEDPVITKANRHIDTLREPFEVSLQRDIGRTDLEPDLLRSIELAFDTSSTMKAFDDIQIGLRNYETALKRTLAAPPVAVWNSRGNRLSIYVDGPIPLTDVHISTAQIPTSVVYDANANGSVDATDIAVPFEATSDGITLAAAWLSNGLIQKPGDMQFIDLAKPVEPAYINTRHDVLFSRPLEIRAVSGANALTKTRAELPRQHVVRAVLPDKRNVPVTPLKREPQVLQGTIHIAENTVFNADVLIRPGTKFLIREGVSMVFRGRLETGDEPDNPVIFTSHGSRPFGTVAVQGDASAGSIIQNVRLSNGSGGIVDGVSYLAALSINDTSDVTLRNVAIEDNKEQDDMLHIVYGRRIVLKDLTLRNARSDALDIDISDVDITNLRVLHAGNDCVDLMQARVTIRRSFLSSCGDKGLSVGERSQLILLNSEVKNSLIGLEAKDGSYAAVVHADFIANKTQFSLFNKNWRYGRTGSVVEIDKSFLDAEKNAFKVRNRSSIAINDSTLVNGPAQRDGVEISRNNDFTDTRTARSPAFALKEGTLSVVSAEIGKSHQRGAYGSFEK
jgi:hypothetical protein